MVPCHEDEHGDIEQVAPGVYRDVNAHVLFEHRPVSSDESGVLVSAVTSSARKIKVLTKVDKYLNKKGWTNCSRSWLLGSRNTNSL